MLAGFKVIAVPGQLSADNGQCARWPKAQVFAQQVDAIAYHDFRIVEQGIETLERRIAGRYRPHQFWIYHGQNRYERLVAESDFLVRLGIGNDTPSS